MDMQQYITPLNNNEAEKLIGGFSSVFTLSNFNDDATLANNCKGGNCAAATCKSQKKIPPAKGKNVNCGAVNCVKGCGTKI